jgi:hypothetical protein
MLRLVATLSKCEPRRQRNSMVERLVTAGLPLMLPGPIVTIDQTAYEFYKLARLLRTETLLQETDNAELAVDEALAEARAKM